MVDWTNGVTRDGDRLIALRLRECYLIRLPSRREKIRGGDDKPLIEFN